jgi:hypothetical protein
MKRDVKLIDRKYILLVTRRSLLATKNITVFWDVTSCNLMEHTKFVGARYALYLPAESKCYLINLREVFSHVARKENYNA